MPACSVSNAAYRFNHHVNVTRNYAVNGLNQYTSAGTASFTYDANGKSDPGRPGRHPLPVRRRQADGGI
ncbi:hypothetical protein [Brevundimonas aurantiaca]|jgi:hypothetical protein|uniref:hypothetical protein n=1 Tax=Brevundimonas aurantiaca TaxID=74316 RepID=UPI00174A72E9|nr:hypothetical protein [Brevundimonas aurantiaca]